MTSVPDSVAAGLVRGDDRRVRCAWAGAAPGFAAYHDTEWGFPVDDDRRLFEKICLEGFQSGLSWRTILDKRPAFREVFFDFDFERVARFGPVDVDRLLGDARIVRHRGKIEATVNNAQRACEVVDAHGSLAALVWRYEPVGRAEQLGHAELRSTTRTAESVLLAKDLKKLGWKFFGPTTAYAFMQAMGLVNDHVLGCAVGRACSEARAAFARPA
jgi:DNA-3-methyladenine glycosylase I